MQIPISYCIGHCVTTAYPGEVCDLDSYAVGCDVNGLTATACRCYETVDLNTTTSNCEGQNVKNILQ